MISKYLGVCVLSVVLASCGVQQTLVGKDEFDPSKVAYFRDDRTNICFAVVSYQRMDSGGKFAYGMSHTAVDCSDKVMTLVK